MEFSPLFERCETSKTWILNETAAVWTVGSSIDSKLSKNTNCSTYYGVNSMDHGIELRPSQTSYKLCNTKNRFKFFANIWSPLDDSNTSAERSNLIEIKIYRIVKQYQISN